MLVSVPQPTEQQVADLYGHLPGGSVIDRLLRRGQQWGLLPRTTAQEALGLIQPIVPPSALPGPGLATFLSHVPWQKIPGASVVGSMLQRTKGAVPEWMFRHQPGEIFDSANTQEAEMPLAEAVQRLQSPAQVALRTETAPAAMKEMGIHGVHHDAIGDWTSGAENSLYTEVRGRATPVQIHRAAARMGAEMNQEHVIAFTRDATGRDTLFRLPGVGGDIARVRTALDAHGVPFRTIVPGTKDVLVASGAGMYDEGVRMAAKDLGVTPTAVRGRVRFLGARPREQAQRLLRRIAAGERIGQQ